MEEAPITTGHHFHSVQLAGSTRAHFGDQYFGGGLTITQPTSVDRPTFAGSYSHSSLSPVLNYVRRPGLERQLHNQLQFTNSTVGRHEMRTVVVWGLGGSGKSQLALNYVQEHRQQYCAVFWVEAGQRKTIERDYLQIYKLLFPSRDNGSTTFAVSDAITGVKNWLQGQEGRCLWVMDSADQIEDAEGSSYVDLHHYLPEAPRLDRIVTTRSSRAQEMSIQEAVAVAEMSEDEATQLFRRCARLQQTTEQNNQAIEAIVKELGCLALAITLAGSYVHEHPDLSSDVGRYLEEFQRQRKQLLGRRAHRLLHQYGESVLSTWEASFNAVQQQSPVAAQLLSLLAFLNFGDIFLPLFMSRPILLDASNHTHCFKRVEGSRWMRLLSIDAAMVNQNTILSAFSTLRAYSLVSWQADEQVYYMHKLVHAWGHDRLSIDQQQTWSLSVLELLSDAMHSCQDDLAMETRLLPHLMANFAAILSACGSAYRMLHLDRKNLRRVGQLLHRLGQWNDEYKVRAFIKQITELELGIEHPDTLASIGSLALVYQKQGRWTEAEELGVQVLETRRRVLGPKHPHTLVSMGNLALVYQKQGRWTEAEELGVQVLETCQRVLGPEHPDTLTSIGNLTLVYQKQGRWAEAEELGVQVLEMRKRVLGPEHPRTLVSMGNLALVYQKQGQWAEAEGLEVQVMEMSQRVLGPEHPRTLVSMGNLAWVYRIQGQWAEAEGLEVQVMEMSQRVLGPEHPNTLVSMKNLAYTLKGQSRNAQAIALMSSCHKLRAKVLGPAHPGTQKAFNTLTKWSQP
ncbi:hypothetical protein H2198_009406 [Neophaeococcomyces mojaviensis]|uniref:Uncharacterized protein n=1 Tax=Neophaeococcomyces mojaviensis TaxID=3383035 RepID=A0ACC2ZV51_9EURO|nr:hypothetical protein H2198_009406 [Knufia sp. JES_112]